MSSQTTNLHFVKPTGNENISRLDYNDNWDKTDDAYAELNGGISNLASGIAIMANGNTHQAIPAGYYVYVRNHDSLTERMYTANSAIAQNATLSANNLTPVTNGGLNSLSDQIAKNRFLDSTLSDSDLEYTQILGDRIADICVIHAQFHIKDGTTAKIIVFNGIIPPGYRPQHDVYGVLTMRNVSEIKPIYIDINGNITIDNCGTVYANQWCGVDISYAI